MVKSDRGRVDDDSMQGIWVPMMPSNSVRTWMVRSDEEDMEGSDEEDKDDGSRFAYDFESPVMVE